MAEGRRGSRPGRTAPQTPTGGAEPAQQAQIPVSEFPITFLDCFLYDFQITRYPEHVANITAPGGQLNVEVAQPAFLNDQMHVSVKARVVAPSEEAPAWSIQATMNGIFVIREGTDPQLVQTFSQTNVLPLLWPYMRELFQSMSIRMRVPPIMLPTLDVRYLSSGPQPGAGTEEPPSHTPARQEEPGGQ